MADFGVKAIRRSWGPDLVVVEGSFTVNATPALALVRPHNISGVTLKYVAVGVYTLLLDQPFQSVQGARTFVGPATAVTGALLTGPNCFPTISQDFLTCDAGGANFAADTTSKKMLILVNNLGHLVDVPTNYRLSYHIVLAESALNS